VWEEFFFVITDATLVNTSTSGSDTKNTGKYNSIGDKKEEKTRARISYSNDKIASDADILYRHCDVMAQLSEEL
jgi:hypothetical protein